MCRPAEVGFHLGAVHPRGGPPEGPVHHIGVLLDHRGGLVRRLHEVHGGRSPAGALDTEGAGTGKEVEDVCTVHHVVGVEPREQRFLDAVGGGSSS